MTDTLLKKINPENKVFLPNLVLFVSFIYFLIILCEDAESVTRKLFYSGLLVLNAAAFVFINAGHYIIANFLARINKLIEKALNLRKKERVEESDEIKKLVE